MLSFCRDCEIPDPTLTASVTPTIYSGKDIYPFNSFTLQCTASKPSNIIPSLQLSWHHHGTQLDNSISNTNNIIFEEEVNDGMGKRSHLSINNARVLNSGSYICMVTVSVPESDDVTTQQAATVTITGIYTTEPSLFVGTEPHGGPNSAIELPYSGELCL